MDNKEILESEVKGFSLETPEGKNILIELTERTQEVLFK